MPITRDLVLTVNNNTASLSEPVYLYRGDRGVELRIKVQQYKYKFNRRTVEDVMTNIYAARAIVHSTKRPEHGHPDQSDSEFCFEIKAVNVEDDIVVIPINRQWIDEITEVGTYKIQIQLYGVDPVNERITIPPVEFFVEEVMCDIPDNTEDSFDNVNRTDETPTNPEYAPNAQGFDSSTKLYTPYKFFPGEVIRSVSLNSMEDALKYLTEEVKGFNAVDEELSNRITSLEGKNTEIEESISDLQVSINETINNTITTEIKPQIKELQDGIKAETEAREELDKTIREDITTSINDMKNTIEGNINPQLSELQEKIAKETEERKSAVTILTANVGENTLAISTERNERQENVADINNSIENLTKIHASDKQDLSERINKNLEDISNTKQTLQNEINRSSEEDNLINRKLDDLGVELNTEKNTRSEADKNINTRITDLESSLNTEILRCVEADAVIQNSITEEIKNRTESDTAIYAEISKLTTTHNNDKSSMEEKINKNTKDISEEVINRTNAVENLSNSVYDKETMDDKLAWLQENIRGPQGTSILTYKGELNSREDLIDRPQIEGDSYIIGTEVYVWNGSNWDSTDILGPQGYWFTPHINHAEDEEGKKTYLSWSNNAPEGLLANPETINIKGDPIRLIMSDEEPEDKDDLWIVESEAEDYATKDYVDKRNFIKCNSCQHIEFVSEYPSDDEVEEGVLYIIYELE